MAPGNSGEQGASFHRVSGDSVRSAGPGWRRSSYVIAGAPGYVDSSATCAVDRSSDTAAARSGKAYRRTSRPTPDLA